MNRVYKEATTSETIFKIKDLLNKAGILVYESLVNNPHKGIYSTRTQTLQSQGNIGQNGKGVTLKYALASGYAELIERLENECISGGRALPITFLKRLKEEFGYYFFPDEKMISEKEFLSLPSYVLDDIFSSTPKNEREKQIHTYFKQLKEKGLDGCIAIPFKDFTTNEIIYLPYNILYILVGSNGMAAGNSINEAIFQGTCELYERYAAALVYYNRLTPPTIPQNEIQKRAPKLYNIIKELEESGFKVIVKDFSVRSLIPSIGVIIIKNNKYRLNIGSDTCFEIALSRCITEIYQGSSSDESIEDIMLPIPKEEFAYFKSDFPKNIDQRTRQFVNFVKNGSGKFPFALFKKEASYPYSFEAFHEQNSYQEEVHSFINKENENGHHFLVRNTSFMGFPAVHVYISKISAIGRKNSSSDMVVDINLSTNVDSDKVKEFFQNDNKLLTNEKSMEKLLSFFPTSIHSNIKLKDLLDLDFRTESPLNYVPVSYLLTLVAVKLKRYKDALSYFKDFTSFKYVEKKRYYKQIGKILTYLAEGADKETIEKNISENVKEDISDKNLFKSIIEPKCPNCDECKLIDVCLTSGVYNLEKHIFKASKENIIQNFTI
jgi:YcaO-like protein with predicted kinase domain